MNGAPEGDHGGYIINPLMRLRPDFLGEGVALAFRRGYSKYMIYLI